MAMNKPMTSEALALHEKKMDMTLDDIIKMSKKPTPTVKKQRVPNKAQKFFNGGVAAGGNSANNTVKVRQFMDNRSSLRQGALAQKRSNFQGNHFPLAAEVARKAAAAPTGNRLFNRSRLVNWSKPRVGAPPIQRTAEGRFGTKQQHLQAKMVPKQQRPQTLDSLFANMKEQRMRVQSQQQNNGRRGGFGPQQQQQQQQRAGWGRGRFGNFAN